MSMESVRWLEARVGVEPTYKGFADPCLTTWLWRRDDDGGGAGYLSRDERGKESRRELLDDLADSLVGVVGDVHHAIRVHGDSGGRIELRRPSRATSAAAASQDR